jgi:6-phosphofructokinase 1
MKQQKKKIRKIAILTGGGDCPGLNAAIRAVVKSTLNELGLNHVIGVQDGFAGLIEQRIRKLRYADVSGIITLGGTVLGASNRANPFKIPRERKGEVTWEDRSDEVVRYCEKLKVEALLCLGGDGTLGIAQKLFQKGVPVIGIPKTIDNDLLGTDVTIGFDTAVAKACQAIDTLHSTAQSHHRVMIVETMGRNAGWIALYSGIASGGDIILIPEIPYDLEKICAVVEERSRRGRRFSILVVAEGARPRGGRQMYQEEMTGPGMDHRFRLGGIAKKIAGDLNRHGVEARYAILGHLLRGGWPSTSDRMLATHLGVEAVRAVADRDFGKMIAWKNGAVARVSLHQVIRGQRLVPKNHPYLEIARFLNVCLGV